jgi:16S rRNA (cytidine1402-2'-O)-methyltransferase
MSWVRCRSRTTSSCPSLPPISKAISRKPILRPRRLPASLASLAAAAPERPVAVCRELTKRFEEVVVGPAADVAARFAEPPKGEIVLVLGPAEVTAGDDAQAVETVRSLVDEGLPRRRAAELVAGLTGRPARELYRRSL